MYIIEIQKDFKKLDGKPFLKMKEGKDGKPVREVDKEGKELPSTKDAQGQEVFVLQTESATYIDMLSGFLNNVFDLVARKAQKDASIKPLKFEDSTLGADVFRAIHVAHQTLELETASHDWLLRMLTEYGVDFIGINIAILVKPIKDAVEREPTRPERRRDSKEK